VRRIFAFEEGGRIRQYEGGYTDYIQKAGEAAQMSLSGDGGAASQANESEASGQETGGKEAYAAYRANRERKLKFSYKEQREYESIEGEIEQLEEKIQQLEDEILKAARDFVKLNELTREKEATEQLLEEKMERWEYLEDLAQQIRAGSSMEG
jgi:ATP-binding cassette subfamily F protein uup